MIKSHVSAPLRPMKIILTLLPCIVSLTYASLISEAVRDSLQLCAQVLIPALFPSMILSELLVQFWCKKESGTTADYFMKKIFRLPGCASGAIFLGMLCGFPVGAKSACDLYRGGFLNEKDTERLIAAANNTGPAFVVEVIGRHYWNSRGFGVVLYLTQIVSAILIGALTARITKVHMAAGANTLICTPKKPAGFLSALSVSVSSSAQATVIVCGFVIFFSSLSVLMGEFLNMLHLTPIAAPLSVLLEVSTGAAASSNIGGAAGAFLTGLALGWSGLSVFAQCRAFCAELEISLRTAVISKLIQGILCGCVMLLWYKNSIIPSAAVTSLEFIKSVPQSVLLGEVLLLIIFCLIPFPGAWKQRKKEL